MGRETDGDEKISDRNRAGILALLRGSANGESFVRVSQLEQFGYGTGVGDGSRGRALRVFGIERAQGLESGQD